MGVRVAIRQPEMDKNIVLVRENAVLVVEKEADMLWKKRVLVLLVVDMAEKMRHDINTYTNVQDVRINIVAVNNFSSCSAAFVMPPLCWRGLTSLRQRGKL